MIEGEHRSMTEISSYMPEFVPQPIAWGKFQQASPETYFFLMEFLDIRSEVADPPAFCAAIARLHSMSTSPNGKFGFHQVTFQGPNPQNTTWEENWCTYFTRLLTAWLDATRVRDYVQRICERGNSPDLGASPSRWTKLETLPHTRRLVGRKYRCQP